jgi:maltose alpha-D-glucosyltransferase / alpha-amylase
MTANGNHFSASDPLWYKDAVIYQLHVKSFWDSTGDGIGDFGGLTRKLDYLESLGVTAVWLLPFYPSPLKDDGYDIADYFNIHPLYGTLRDFKNFLREAHHRNIRVITELVLNHTSDQHDWFKRSRTAEPGSFWRDFYMWSDTGDGYREARIIFKDFETSNWSWDPVARAYYFHRFYSHQPDLNYENPHVHTAILKVIDYWLGMGVDGVRLDAVPYLYKQEGTNCENLAKTFEFLRKLRAHVDENFPDRMLLAEANQWPEDAAAYFGRGDMCHMAFHFPLMPRMFMALRKEDRFPIIDILDQTPQIPDTAQWAVFLRNHDELTLEMVTEEEREYMYRSYAHDPSSRINLGIRRRLAPLLQNSRRRMELMNILMFSLPGSPIVYYGDEIGMGDNHFLGDRNGVRTPMQWSGDRNAGFSLANPQRLYLPLVIDPEYNYETVNVENEERNSASLLWWMRRTVAMRRKYRAFARGTLEFVRSDNSSVLTFVRRFGEEIVFVAVNLSRFCQMVSVDLKAFAGYTPYDIFSANKFPRISETPYVLTMGFHDYFWFSLRKERTSDLLSESYRLPELRVDGSWADLFDGSSDDQLEMSVLPPYLQQRTTAGCKPATIAETKILDRLSLEEPGFTAIILFVRVSYVSGEPDVIALPLSVDAEEQVNRVIGDDKGLIAALVIGGATGMLYDCAFHPRLHSLLLNCAARRWRLHGDAGTLAGAGTAALRKAVREEPALPLPITVVKAGLRNTSFSYANRLLLKLFRRLEEGANPDIELHRLLSAQPPLAKNVAPFYGSIEYRIKDGSFMQVGMLTGYVSNTGTAWSQAIDAAAVFFEEVLATRSQSSPDPKAFPTLLGVQGTWEPAGPDKSLFGPFFEAVKVLGARTARMHAALSQGQGTEFAVEPFSPYYQRELFQSTRNAIKQSFSAGARNESLDKNSRDMLARLAESEKGLMAFLGPLLKTKLSGGRSRIHGDLHLGQFVAVTNDFVVKDFEGDPNLSLSERRTKRSPLRDAASMVHSLHRAAYYGLRRQVRAQQKELQLLGPWAETWCDAMSAVFLSSYLDEMSDAAVLPRKHDEQQYLLALFLLDRATGEIRYDCMEGKCDLSIPAQALRKYVSVAAKLQAERGAAPAKG